MAELTKEQIEKIESYIDTMVEEIKKGLRQGERWTIELNRWQADDDTEAYTRGISKLCFLRNLPHGFKEKEKNIITC